MAESSHTGGTGDWSPLSDYFLDEVNRHAIELGRSFQDGDLRGVGRIAQQIYAAADGYGFRTIGELAASTQLAAVISQADEAGLDTLAAQVNALISQCRDAAEPGSSERSSEGRDPHGHK